MSDYFERRYKIKKIDRKDFWKENFIVSSIFK